MLQRTLSTIVLDKDDANKVFEKLAEDKSDEPIVFEKPQIDGSKVIYIPDGDVDLESDDEDETERCFQTGDRTFKGEVHASELTQEGINLLIKGLYANSNKKMKLNHDEDKRYDAKTVQQMIDDDETESDDNTGDSDIDN